MSTQAAAPSGLFLLCTAEEKTCPAAADLCGFRFLFFLYLHLGNIWFASVQDLLSSATERQKEGEGRACGAGGGVHL